MSTRHLASNVVRRADPVALAGVLAEGRTGLREDPGGTLEQWERIGPDLRLTTSVGVATAEGPHELEALVHLADGRLYEAKRAGRDRVIADPVADPDADPDAGPDTDPDAGPDTDPDAGPDTDPDAGPDTDPDAGPDTDSDAEAGPVAVADSDQD